MNRILPLKRGAPFGGGLVTDKVYESVLIEYRDMQDFSGGLDAVIPGAVANTVLIPLLCDWVCINFFRCRFGDDSCLGAQNDKISFYSHVVNDFAAPSLD